MFLFNIMFIMKMNQWKFLITRDDYLGELIVKQYFSPLNRNIVMWISHEQLLNYLPALILSPHWTGLSVCLLCTAEQPFHGLTVQKIAVLGGAGDCFVCCQVPFLIPQDPAMPLVKGGGRVRSEYALALLAALKVKCWGQSLKERPVWLLKCSPRQKFSWLSSDNL